MPAFRAHPSAVVDPSAVIGEGAELGPNTVVEAGVKVGPRTRLLAGTVLQQGTVVGADCVLGPYAVLGSLPMDTAFGGEESFVIIGDGVQIRDFATVHRATGAGEATRVGDGTQIMTYVHVSHNAQVGRSVILTSGSQLGGHSSVGDRAVLGAGASLHQFVRVGELAMIGAMSGLNRDALPFTLVHGVFGEHYGLNRVGLKRSGILGERYSGIERAYRALRRGDRELFSELASSTPDVAAMQEFMATSRRGISAMRGKGGASRG